MNPSTVQPKSCTCGQSASAGKRAEASALLGDGREMPIMLALLPCGLRNAFQQAVLAAFPEYSDVENPKIVIEGNLNAEKSLFRSIDKLTSLDEIPDIFISSDINGLYHQRFRDKFLNASNFETFSQKVHPMFEQASYVHPEGLMVWFTTNLLVMVVDTHRLGNRPLPTSWFDLLDESYARDLTLRGDTDFFCNAMFFPYLKSLGDEAIRQLGRNTAKGLHPSQMVKMLHTGNLEGSTVYVLPYSFASKVRDNQRFRVVFPQEGPIVSPVQMLVKKGAYLKHQALVDFIMGEEMARVLAQTGFPTAHPSSENSLPSNSLYWLGWDFIQNNDMGACKEKMQELFFAEFRGGVDGLLGQESRK